MFSIFALHSDDSSPNLEMLMLPARVLLRYLLLLHHERNPLIWFKHPRSPPPLAHPDDLTRHKKPKSHSTPMERSTWEWGS